MTPTDIEEINRSIGSSGAKWKAAETPISKLSRSDQLKRLGYVPGPSDKSLQERESIAKSNLQAFLASAPTPAATFPVTYDLRDVGGQNFITPIKDQGWCGSCVAFGTLATAEGTLRRQSNSSSLNIDLSEAHLFYCYGRNDGRNCGNGWYPNGALDHFRNDGVADEACYPYTDVDQNCSNLCANWKNRLTKITAWHLLTSVTDIKNWISTKGPVVACFTVYDDFYAYLNGIYSHVSGNQVGGHCVSVVGYNDTEKYWICKNSWGPGFGESGFFRIAYGQCGIDSYMWAIDVVTTQPVTAWSNWESLGGVLYSGPAACSWGSGRLDIFVKAQAGDIDHKWFQNGWSNWESLGNPPGGAVTSDPAAVSWGNGRIDLFVRGADNALWHKWFQNGWSGWESLGGVLSSGPDVSSWAAGRLDVFIRGTDNALWHKWFDNGWSGWESLGGVLTSDPAGVSWGNGRIDVFIRGTDNALWHKWFPG